MAELIEVLSDPSAVWQFAPENLPGPKTEVVFQPSFFRGYVKLQGCRVFKLASSEWFLENGWSITGSWHSTILETNARPRNPIIKTLKSHSQMAKSCTGPARSQKMKHIKLISWTGLYQKPMWFVIYVTCAYWNKKISLQSLTALCHLKATLTLHPSMGAPTCQHHLCPQKGSLA